MRSDDDTVLVPPRVPPEPGGPDLEDTVTTGRGIVPGPQARLVTASPAFYAFRIGDGAPVLLDRPCYLGRTPSMPRIVDGPLPRLLRVQSPLREVSATHLEVRQLGSSVVVTDTRSTNGSVVALPGSVPRRLRQGESVVVVPGTMVDIGDGNVVHILPMQAGERSA